MNESHFLSSLTPEMLTEQTVFNHLRNAILVVDDQRRVVQCNDAASQLFGRDRNKILGAQLERLFPGSGVLKAQLERVLAEGKSYSLGEFPLEIPLMEDKVVEVSLSPIFDAGGEITQAVLTIKDQTYHFHTKEKEQERAILDSIGILVSSIAHEIQNPLSGVKGVTQLLQRTLEKHKLSTQPTEMILNELARIDRLLRQLLLHSHPMPLEWATFNLHELLDSIVWFEENNPGTGVKIVRHFDPSLPEMTADRDKMHQVFLNLIKNAAEASEEGGRVIIRTKFCPRWQIAGKRLDPKLTYYLIEVEDFGPGVPHANVEQLFKPLFTTKRTGNGLGLSISFRIVQEHGGLLQYRPADHGGSIFQVYVPRDPAPGAPAAPSVH